MAVRKAEVLYVGDAASIVRAAKEAEAAQAQLAASAKAAGEEMSAANKATGASSDAAAATVRRNAAKTSAAFGAQSSALTKFGKTASLGLLGAAAASVSLAVKFQSNTLRMQNQAGATTAQLGKLRDGLLQMAKDVGFTPNQLADGMYHVVSAMNAVIPAAHRTADELHIMKVAAEGAQIGHANLEDTTYTLVSAINALHAPASSAAKIMGQLNAIVGSGDMTMTDLEEALKSGLIPTARAFGLSMQSVGAALSVMGDMGMRGALAGTRLRMSLALLGAPSAKAAGILQSIGLSASQSIAKTKQMSDTLDKAGVHTDQLAADLRKPNGIMVALADLNQHLIANGLSATGAAALISSAFGGGRSGAAIQTLEQNLSRVNVKFDQIGHQGDQFGQSWLRWTQSSSGQLHMLEGNVTSLGTQLGTALLPVLNTVTGDLSAFVGWVEKGGPAVHALEIAVGTLATVGIGSYLVSKLVTVIKLLREFRSLAGSPLSAISRLGAASAPGMVAGAGVPAGGVTAAASRGIGLRLFDGLGIAALGTMISQTIGSAIKGGVGRAVSDIGTGASIGGGLGSLFGPWGAAVGATLGGAIGGVIDLFVSHGPSDGQKWATGFVSALPGQVSSAVKKGLARAGNISIPSAPGTAPPGQTGGLKGLVGLGDNHALDLARQMVINARLDLHAHPDPATEHQLKVALAFYQHEVQAGFNAMAKVVGPLGANAGNAWVSSLQKVKFPTTFLLTRDMTTALNKVPQNVAAAGSQAVQVWRDSAAKQMISYATSLEQHGKLPKHSVDQMIASLEAQFPGLIAYLDKSGLNSEQAVANHLKLTGALSNLKSALGNMRTQWGDAAVNAKITNANIYKNTAQAMSDLRTLMQSKNAEIRKEAAAEYKGLQGDVNHSFQAMLGQTTASMKKLTALIQAGSKKAADYAGQNMARFSDSVYAAMNSGVMSSAKGAQLLQQNTNAILKAFGAKAIPLAAIVASEPPNSHDTTGSGIGHRATGGLVDRPTIIMGEEAPRHPEYVLATNPAYRKRNRGLWAQAGRALGIPGFAQGGVILDSGVNMSVGQEPQILGDLRNLSMRLHELVYVISGYRSPAHSVAVGGFANDPHTRGQAADIGVGSASRASMFGVAEAVLRGVGLYRPFYPPDPNEVNHVQLLGGGSAGGGGFPALKTVQAPHVAGTGTVSKFVQAAMNKGASAANAYLRKQYAKLAPVSSGHFSGGATSAGGQYDLAQLEAIWQGGGGPGGAIAHVAAAIALAESSGRNVMQQGQPYATTGWGLWQITPGNSEPQDGTDQALLNPSNNARAAVAKWRSAGDNFTPWTTYGDGAYQQFMARGGVLNPIPRANGGPVIPGNAYMVGENGPEVVAFRQGGYVHKNPGASHHLTGGLMTVGELAKAGLDKSLIYPVDAILTALQNLVANGLGNHKKEIAALKKKLGKVGDEEATARKRHDEASLDALQSERKAIETRIRTLTNQTTANVNRQIAELTQLQAFKDAITSIKTAVSGLVSQAGQTWLNRHTNSINAAHSAAIKAIGNSPAAIELRKLQAQDVTEQNAQQLASLNQAVTDAQALADHSGGQTHLDALQQLKDAQTALSDYQRQQLETQLQKQITTATTAADKTQKIHLAELHKEDAAFKDSLRDRFAALTKSLNKGKLTYAAYAKDVNKILHNYHLTLPTDSGTEGAIGAGPGPLLPRHPHHERHRSTQREGLGKGSPSGGPSVVIQHATFSGTRQARAFADRMAHRAMIGTA